MGNYQEKSITNNYMVPSSIKRLITVAFVINIIVVLMYAAVILAQNAIVVSMIGRTFPDISLQIPIIASLEMICLSVATTVLFILINKRHETGYWNRSKATIFLFLSSFVFGIKIFSTGILNTFEMRFLAQKGSEFMTYRSMLNAALYHTQPFYTVVVIMNLIALSLLCFSLSTDNNKFNSSL